MRAIIIVAIVLSTGLCKGQTQFGFFSIENENLIWQKVYERPGMSMDSISKMLYSNIKLDNSLSLINENEEELLFSMKGKMFEKDDDKNNGRVSIEIKDEKYRVTISGGSMNYGVKSMKRASGFISSDQLNQEQDWESLFIKKGAVKNNLNRLRLLDEGLVKDFDYQLKVQKDW